MNKSYFSIAALLFIMIFTSAQYNDTAEAVKGQVAPAISLDNKGNKLSLQAAHGQYVLVTFWSAANPTSRIDNQTYSKCIKGNSHIKHVAVNLDRSEAFMKQLIIVDQLNPDSQIFLNIENRPSIMTQWNISNDNLASFLIDDKGIVIDKNPSAETLAKL